MIKNTSQPSPRSHLTENELSHLVVGFALKIHRRLGPGLLESVYQECLFFELARSGAIVEKQKALPLIYDDVKLECGFRVDLLIEKKVVIEIKSVEALNDVHLAQVLTYLRLSSCRLGLLINFNVSLLKYGIMRVANNL
ncbi:MAG: GxxExxY protein [Cytophagales bacterium]|nr:GxxExxY protein [Cytophagales bacterium]